MNRKKVIDYTVTRRTRDRDSFGTSSNPRDSRDQRDRGSNGARDSQPLWSKDDKNSMERNRTGTLQGSDAALKDLQDKIARKVLSQEDNSKQFRRGDGDTRSREGSKGSRLRGPIVDEFSEDSYDLHSNAKSRDRDYKDDADRRSRRTDDSSAGKRTYGAGGDDYPDDSPSRWKNIDDSPTFESASETKYSLTAASKKSDSRIRSDDDLRNVLKTFQKSKWDDDSESQRFETKDYDKYKRGRKEEDLGVSSPSGLFSMSSKGTLVSIPLEPPPNRREEYLDFARDDYREKDRWDADNRDSREFRDSSYSKSSRYRTDEKDRRGRLDDELRGLSSDQELRDLEFSLGKSATAPYDSLQRNFGESERELGLGTHAESSYYEPIGSLDINADVLRDLPLSEFARKSGKKYRSGFELGRPFFGEDSKEKDWQDSEYGEASRGDSTWSSKDDRRDRDAFTKDGVLPLPRGGKDMLTDRLARRPLDRKPSNTTRPHREDKEEAYGPEKPDRATTADKLSKNATTTKSTSYTKAAGKEKVPPLLNKKPGPPSVPSQKLGPKPKFVSTFLPRQLKVVTTTNALDTSEAGAGKVKATTQAHTVGQGSADLKNPPSLKKSGGYVPKYAEKRQSRSRTRSPEKANSRKDERSGSSSSTREVKPPSKPTFTSQNWSDLDSRDSKPPTKANGGLLINKDKGGKYERGGAPINPNRGRGGVHRGRGGTNANSQGNVDGSVARGRGRGRARGFVPGGRGRGVGGPGSRGRGFVNRGRGRSSTPRGRGFVPRGRGFIPRGRGRGGSVPQRGKLPVGTSVRNIFRRSRSLSVSSSDSRRRRSSLSPGRHRHGRKSRRDEGRRGRRSRSRSRSSSFCSTCSSGSCSTCTSWRSLSVGSVSGKGDRSHSKHHKTKAESRKEDEKGFTKSLDRTVADKSRRENDKESTKSLDKVKADKSRREDDKESTKSLEIIKADKSRKEGDKETAKSLDRVKADKSRKEDGKEFAKSLDRVKADKYKKDDSKESTKSLDRIKADIKTMEKKLEQKKSKGLLQTEVKQEKTKDEKVKDKDKPNWLKDALLVKEQKEKTSHEVKKESDKSKGSVREVILKSDKLKELSVPKSEKGSPLREVKIVSEKNRKGDKGPNETFSSKMKLDKLEITIDRPALGLDTKRDKKKDKDKERSPYISRKSSRSPPGKVKKKEKVKSKKASRKAKKKKRDRDSEDDELESIYSSISGEGSSTRERKNRSMGLYDDDDDYVKTGGDSKRIAVHYAAERRGSDTAHPSNSKYQSSPEGPAIKNIPSRGNLISIPLPKEPDAFPINSVQQQSISLHGKGRMLTPPMTKGVLEYPAQIKRHRENSNADAYPKHNVHQQPILPLSKGRILTPPMSKDAREYPAQIKRQRESSNVDAFPKHNVYQQAILPQGKERIIKDALEYPARIKRQRENSNTDAYPKHTVHQQPILPQGKERITTPPLRKSVLEYPAQMKRQRESSNARYPEEMRSNEDASNVDWSTEKFAEEGDAENVSSEHGGHQDLGQDWAVKEDEGVGYENYYYEEGTEGTEGVLYEQEYYSYPEEGDWQGADQAVGAEVQEGEYQEWNEAEYVEQGEEGEAYAQYYIGEDGQYYLLEGEAYESQQEEGYVEGEVEGGVQDAEQGHAVADEEYGYQYVEEGVEWQPEVSSHQAEEGWSGVEGEWSEEYQQGYYEAGSEWTGEYAHQDGGYEAAEQDFPVETDERVQGDGYGSVEGYGQQFVHDPYYAEHNPAQEQTPDVDHGIGVQRDDEMLIPEYDTEPLMSKANLEDASTASDGETEESRPLRSILKKPKQQELQADKQRSKLVSERLAQLRKQSTSKIQNSSQNSGVALAQESGREKEQAAEDKSESDQYREMEEAILSSQPKDAIGTECIVRVHGSGTANFYCKLCRCHFNTLTAKNLHIKGMKHIELYIRLKSSLLQSVIKDTKSEPAKRPAQEDPLVMQKVPRRF